MMHRRFFLRQTGIASVTMGLSSFPLASPPKREFVLTVLHTNDVHSRIDPFPMDGSRNEGRGGVKARARLIESIRAKEKHVLLLDSGDMWQGTPYFNFFGGEIEYKVMSQLQYDAATLGNHDFDAGIEGLIKNRHHARFPLVISNYDFSDTAFSDQTNSNLVIEKEGFRIGIFGLGIELKHLVPDNLFGETRYLDPIICANREAGLLKNEQNCDYVICLSHLGYRYRDSKIDDRKLAASTRNINLILGGHTHTFLLHPEVIPDLDGQPVMINQAGWGGLQLGRIDVRFEYSKKDRCASCENLWIV